MGAERGGLGGLVAVGNDLVGSGDGQARGGGGCAGAEGGEFGGCVRQWSLKVGKQV